MLEAMLLIGLGAAVGKLGLFPFTERLARAQERRDAERADQIVRAVHAEVARQLGHS